MTAELHRTGRRNGAPLFYAGWAGFALFGTVVFLDGHADLVYAASHVLVAVAICAWYALTAGKAAPIAGAVLGTLFALQMTLFVVSGAIDGESLKVRIEDGFGLLAAVCILLGAVRTVRGGRAAAGASRSAAGASIRSAAASGGSGSA